MKKCFQERKYIVITYRLVDIPPLSRIKIHVLRKIGFVVLHKSEMEGIKSNVG